jgi:hypothetical protein
MIQLDLFGKLPNEEKHRYWRKRLKQWPCEVFESRHHLDTTGWSMATQASAFAHWLHKDGAMTDMEYMRWTKFERRVERWERRRMK